jgi:GTP-binding protein
MTENKKMPLVVLFGRTNVGKSTLFNVLTGKKIALVSAIEGATRDANIGTVDWQGKKFRLVDTGGILDVRHLHKSKKEIKEINKTDDINAKVQQQAREYLKKANLILFMVDAQVGIMGDDKTMALELKKIIPQTKNILLVVNKSDSPKLRRDVNDFNKLALGEPISVSALTSSGTGDLLDIVTKHLKIRRTKDIDTTKDSNKTINVTIIGKPNVGKSSLINKLIDRFSEDEDAQKMITSATAHTTREPKDVQFNYQNYLINLIDTAGISKSARKNLKKGRSHDALEKFSIEKSIATLNKADIALLMIDIHEGITQQESKIIDDIIEKQVSLIIVANKWDLIENRDTKKFKQSIYNDFPYATWAPIQFISALTGEKVEKTLELIVKLAEARKTEINENYLSKFLLRIVKKHSPVRGGGVKNPFIYKLRQTRSNPPKFEIVIGSDDNIDQTYVRYVENQIRKNFKIEGTPVFVSVVHKKGVHGQHDPNKLNNPEKKKKPRIFHSPSIMRRR